jgi:hypothetical protein
MSRAFMDGVLLEEHGGEILKELEELVRNRRTQKDGTASFLEEVTHRLREMLRAGTAPLEAVESWSGLVREAIEKLESVNIPASNVLENLFLRMRETAAAVRPGLAAGVEAGGAAR